MRVTTQLAYERAIDAMNDRQARLVRSQEELATGRKLLSASDDPMAAAEAERARSQLRRLEIQQRMNDFATNMLGQAETTLSRVTDLMQSLREGFVQAGNGSLSPTDRGLLAQQFGSYREELYALANRQDGAGGYVFGGQGTRAEPFSIDGTVTYAATPGEQQVGLDSRVPTSVDGRATFMSVPTASGPRSVFDIVDEALAVLGDPGAARPAVTAAVNSALAGIDSALARVQHGRTDTGDHLRALEARGSLNETSHCTHQSQLSHPLHLPVANTASHAPPDVIETIAIKP